MENEAEFFLEGNPHFVYYNWSYWLRVLSRDNLENE